jgi:hypothetical protein
MSMSDETPLRPNTQGLLAHAQRKSEETLRRVHQAIDRLLREQQVVNFNTVAKTANVTKSYLYANADVRERIEVLRVQQGQERRERQGQNVSNTKLARTRRKRCCWPPKIGGFKLWMRKIASSKRS